MWAFLRSMFFLALCAATGVVLLGGRFLTPARRERAPALPTNAATPETRISPTEPSEVAPIDQLAVALKAPSLEHCVIEVEFLAGKVVLQGHVATDEQRALAEVTAAGVPGILHVENRLLVQSRKAVERTNQDLATDVKDAIKKVQLTGYEINISVVNKSEVTLTGQVTNAEHRELAGKAAGSVPGIQRVDNRLVVSGGYATNQSRYSPIRPPTTDHFVLAKGPTAFKFSNQQLAETVHRAIKEAFVELPEDDSSIEITALHGGIRLKGIVRSARMKAEAEAAASSVPGVVYVENLLSVAESELTNSSGR